jgi:hypothetical protein
MQNLGRCPRCGKFMIAEQQRSHRCDFRAIPIQGCEELVLDHITDSGKDENGDYIHLAWGQNGMLYILRVCNHHPLHAKRVFTDPDTKHGLDNVVLEALLPLRRSGRAVTRRRVSSRGDTIRLSISGSFCNHARDSSSLRPSSSRFEISLAITLTPKCENIVGSFAKASEFDS